MDIRLALMCGTDIPVPEIQSIIHQPKIREIAYIGEQDFFIGMQCFCINKDNLHINEGESLLRNTSNFQIFMTMMQEKEMVDKKYAARQFLTLLFPNKKILFTPRSIMLQGEDNTSMIDENSFEILQSLTREIFCTKSSASQELGFNPANETAKKIADKLMRGRQRVAELNGNANASIFSQYLSMLTVGLNSMSLQDLMDLTMFQLFDLVERYQLYINWDIDIRSRLAGAKSDNKPENWMKNIH